MLKAGATREDAWAYLSDELDGRDDDAYRDTSSMTAERSCPVRCAHWADLPEGGCAFCADDASLTGYHRTEAEYPELRTLPTFSAAWYRTWRTLHEARYPALDPISRANLDMLVDLAEKREAS